jgi:apolipoprotein N-acyltransferase
MHLVLFGEVLPFRNSSPFLFNLLMKFNPYGYDHSLDAGTEYTVFEMADPPADSTSTLDSQPYKFSVIICYEATIPAIARRFALDKQGRKQIDWLINISNDGWFVRFKDEKVLPSTELAQHMAICVFRAVENRLSIINGSLAGTLPDNAIERQGIAGWFADKLPIDKRITFFSKYGQWLDFCCAICLLLLIIIPVSANIIRNKKYVIFSRQRKNEK